MDAFPPPPLTFDEAWDAWLEALEEIRGRVEDLTIFMGWCVRAAQERALDEVRLAEILGNDQ